MLCRFKSSFGIVDVVGVGGVDGGVGGVGGDVVGDVVGGVVGCWCRWCIRRRWWVCMGRLFIGVCVYGDCEVCVRARVCVYVCVCVCV